MTSYESNAKWNPVKKCVKLSNLAGKVIMENNKLRIKQLYYDPVDYDKLSELNNIVLTCKICNLTLHVEKFTFEMIDAQRFDYKFDEGTRTLQFICKWCLDPSHNNDSNIIKFHGLHDKVWLPGELPKQLREARKILKKVEALYNDERRRYYEENGSS